MIDLKSVVEKYPECLDSATKFKSYMMDLYPDNSNKARIRILADMIDCGIATAFKNGKKDDVSIANFCNSIKKWYGYAPELVEECINILGQAFTTNSEKTTDTLATNFSFEIINKEIWRKKRELISPFKKILTSKSGFWAFDLNDEIVGYDEYKKESFNLSGTMRPIKLFACGSYWACCMCHDGSKMVPYTDSRYANVPQKIHGPNIDKICGCEQFCLALKNDGTVIISGLENGVVNKFQLDLQKWCDITDISCDDTGVIGLCSDGSVLQTRYDSSSNSMGYDVSGWCDIIEISCGYSHYLGLKHDGTVIATGIENSENTGCLNVKSWDNIVAISASTNHSVGLKADGTVVATGSNFHGQCNVDKWENIIAISAGYTFTVGLKEDGTILSTCGDSNLIYQIPNLKLFDNYLTYENEKLSAKKNRERLLAQRRQKGLCQHCGGKFKGVIFGKYCSQCRLPKDY